MARKLFPIRRTTDRAISSGSPAKTQRFYRRPLLETLETRVPMASDVAISDASALEGSGAMKFIDNFVTPASGGLSGPRHLLFGPDANGDDQSDLYVPSRWTNQVLTYDGTSGAFIGVLLEDPRLLAPWAMTLGPDGNLYIGGADSHNVLRYSFSSETVDEFLPAGAPGLIQPKTLAFGPDGNLYVNAITPRAIGDKDEVLRFQGPLQDPGDPAPGTPLPAPGQSGAVFIPDGAGGANAIDFAKGLAFGTDVTGDGIAEVYVSSGSGDSVNRYSGATGAFLDVFVSAGSGGLNNPDFLMFRDGSLYVSSQSSAEVMRYSASSGSFVDVFVPRIGAVDIAGFAFDSKGNIYVAANGPDPDSRVVRYGPASQAAFTVSLSSASESPISVEYTTADGTAIANSDHVAASGTLTFAPGQTSQTILIQTVDNSDMELNETFSVLLSNPQGAALADDTGVATIIDDDAKFYVVNDAVADSTFRYDGVGSSGASSTLDSGNLAPRGAASTAAGDRVWVVDANKKVYVYDAGGTLLGSWTAGSLPQNAQVQGIATDGTNIWIVDASSDKVYRYSGAASRVSGSQNATSSFSLNKSNKNPKDIVTDGMHLWVVDDSTTDKVFKYTLSGSLLGSWTISTTGATTPTGITLDPSNPAHLWIVDAGADTVYEYANAVNQANGSSKSATANFLLAPGNTNPQGIADPPAAPSAASFVAPTPTKEIATTAALARSAAAPAFAVGPPQSAAARPVYAAAPVAPAQQQLEAVDTALAQLFDPEEPHTRPIINKLLYVERLIDELAKTGVPSVL